MSGGVDSSVAAALLAGEGCRVIGITALVIPESCCKRVPSLAEKQEKGLAAARRTAEQLGVQHHAIDLRDTFYREVITPFAAEYAEGRTPSPCGLCNPRIKFGALFERSRRLGAEVLATGHYVRRTRAPDGRFRLWRGRDLHKDQSYFLFGVSQEQLRYARFPVGGMRKEETRKVARELGLAAERGRESQEICFVDEQGHGAWMEAEGLIRAQPGDIVDTQGRKVGEHKGIHHMTIGQRRGLNVATGERVYVVEILADRGVVVVGRREEAMRRDTLVSGVNWISGEAPGARFTATAQVRYNQRAQPCGVEGETGGGVRVHFDEPQFAVTPGQIAAFYQGEELLGGGWIGRRRG